MSTSNVYLTLPSNSSMTTYPENTLTHYTTKLQMSLSLTGSWELALEEISLPRSWFQIPRGEGFWSVQRDFWSGLPPGHEGERIYKEYNMRPGFEFDTPEQVVTPFNVWLREDLTDKDFKVTDANGNVSTTRLTVNDTPRFVYDKMSKRVKAYLPPGYTIRMSSTLLAILGFHERQLTNRISIANTSEGLYAVDLRAGIHQLYVYCNVAESVPVGDTLAPLLRIVETRNPKGGFIHEVFNPPRYIPVQIKNFDTITIDIRTSFGSIVPFESGAVVCTLHFKRSASEYFL